MPFDKTIIVGAGIGGLATAIRLAVKGYTVEVFEANATPGGKLSEFTVQGYRFDAGPSLFTMPQYVDELFTLAGKNARNYFNYERLDKVCHYFYEDGTQINAWANTENLANEIEDQTGQAKTQVVAHSQYSRRIYDITNHVFLHQSLHRLKTYLNWATLKSIFRLSGIDAQRTMDAANKSYFADSRIVQFYNRYATYNGSNPYQAPATLNVIPYFEQHFGAYFPQGGMYAITQALYNLAMEVGVKFNFNSRVDEIVLAGKQVTGVMVNGGFVKAGAVISNMDVWFTYKQLLAKHTRLHPAKTLAQQRSSSALIFYWGISHDFEGLDLHNIFFSADYRAEFNALWKDKTIWRDPTVYVNISAKHEADDAPPGCENWFVMINVPANTGQNWDALIAEARVNIIRKLSRLLGHDISKLIQYERVLDPRSIESQTSSYQGALYGTSSNNRFAAFLRHPNKSSKINNLYFCGGSVHPGGGIPLCLLSAKIVADWFTAP